MVCLGNRKRLKRADRTYKDLKQKQKAKIADSMFEKTCDYYREHGKLPEGEDCERIAGQIYQRVKGIAEKASFDEIYSLYLYRLPCYEVRIAENGIPEKKEKKKDKIMIEKEQIFYKSQVVLVRKLANLTQT